ncbi:hypothetical protein [Photobacterium leiognathi]|uniref:hypothetical protein n=1 Tax=Photobacterium leiognathi TaxID=553611 RepID=UPI0029810E47|nr:hypothetical protein [Photobacterium leiognathi]
MIKKSVCIAIGGLVIVAIAVLAMTNENNYQINPCPNAAHNQSSFSESDNA